MHTFVKVTAIILIVLGILIVLSGIGLGIAGMMMRGAAFRMPMRAAMPGFGMMGVFLAFIPGVVLTGLGQALYLLNELAWNATRSLPAAPVVHDPAAQG